MFKRLSGPTGEIADTKIKPDDTPDKIVRSAILVHSGSGGKENTLASSDGDISFDEKRIRSVVDNHNKMITQLAVEYGGFDKMPVGAYPPILDQHSDDSNDRIRGRLTGLLRFERRSVPKVGDNVACAVCDITFLGKDTVDQVNDGRIYHLSVGIDENSDTLGETSTVIEPAAPGAMVLNKRKNKKLKGAKMSTKELKAAVTELKKLSKSAAGLKKKMNLTKRKGEVKSQFTKLMAAKKMSPAEFRKLDLVKLAKLDKEHLDTVMSVYESRETILKSGQQGTTSATVFSDVGTKTSEDREVKRLKAAAKKNLTKLGVKFKEMEKDDDDKKEMSADKEEMDKKDLSMDDNGMGGDQSADDDNADVQANEEMMQQIEENAAQIARVASMVENIIEKMNPDDEGDESEMSDDDDDDASEMSKDDDDKKDDEKESDDKDDDDKDKKDKKKDLESKDDDKDKKDLADDKDKKDLEKEKEESK